MDSAQEVDPLQREPVPPREPTDGERVGADEAQARPVRSCTPGHARRRTGRPLRGSLRPMKTTFPFRPPGRPRAEVDPVRDHLEGPADVRLGCAARRLGHGDPLVDPPRQHSPEKPAERIPAEPLPRRVAGDDERARSRGERVGREHRRQRLVDVDDVEALALPDATHAQHRLRAEDDVGEGRRSRGRSPTDPPGARSRGDACAGPASGAGAR